MNNSSLFDNHGLGLRETNVIVDRRNKENDGFVKKWGIKIWNY